MIDVQERALLADTAVMRPPLAPLGGPYGTPVPSTLMPAFGQVSLAANLPGRPLTCNPTRHRHTS